MRLLVTGGAGFIGSSLVERLLGRGEDVVCLDNFDSFYDPRIKWRNIQRFADHPRFELALGDLRHVPTVEAVFASRPVDLVVHLAARAGVRPSIAEPALYYDVNCTGTANLYEACRKFGTTRVVFASSSSVYGGNTKVPFSETDPVEHPVSPYAATKRAGELLAWTFWHLHGIASSCLRFFTVYGPRQRPEMAIHRFVDRVMRGEPIPVFGDGTSSRDYTYIDDIVDGILRAMEHTAAFDTFNLGNSSPVLLSDLVRIIGEATGREPIIERLPFQPGDVETTYADVSRARDTLGWEPHIGIEEGVRRTVDWVRRGRE
jgi:UDP-glucuronate 4-epimerase